MLLWQSSSYLLSLLEAKQKGERQFTFQAAFADRRIMISICGPFLTLPVVSSKEKYGLKPG